MPSTEYLEAILERVKRTLSDEEFRALNRAAIPRAGGKASWRSASTTKLEALALKELKPSMLMNAEDDELSAIWARLKQWFKRAKRRGQDTEPFERAGSHVAQEMYARGMGHGQGEMLELVKVRSQLTERLEELPDVIVLEDERLELVHENDGSLSVFGPGWDGMDDDHRQMAVGRLEDIGVPSKIASSDRWTTGWPSAESFVPLYDLALVRSSKLEKSVDEPEYLTKAEAHSGAMIAIMAPSSVRTALTKAGLLKAGDEQDLHVTMLYLGKADDICTEARNQIRSKVEKVCRDHRPLRMELSGFGQFSSGKDGVPLYAVASAVGLSQLQADLERAVEQVVDLPSEHGWVPHLTLGYLTDASEDSERYTTGVWDSLTGKVEPPEWTAESVRIQMAGEPFADCALQGQEPTEKADWDVEAEPDEMFASSIACSAPDKQIIFYECSEPGTKDAHGHRITEDDVEDALHGYIANSREVKLEHGKTITGRAIVVQGFTAPMELTEFHGQKPPNGPIKKGTSIVAIHYTDTKLWKNLSSIEHGLSWGGYARKVTR